MSTTDPPITDRTAINRENARRSTGPKTPEGKATSRLNAMRHILCSQTVVSTKSNKFQGRHFRFTDVSGEVVRPLLV